MAKKVISLDAAREAAEEKYASAFVPVGKTEVELVNPVRLSKEKRGELSEMQSALREDGVDQVAAMENILRLVSRTDSQGEALVKAVGGDLAVLMEVFSQYSESAQVGEAQPSED